MKNLSKKILSLLLVTVLFTLGLVGQKASAYPNHSFAATINQVTNVKDYGGDVYAKGDQTMFTSTGENYDINTTNVGVQVKTIGGQGSVAIWVDGSYVPDNGHLLGYSYSGNTYLQTFLVENLSHGTHRIQIRVSMPTGTNVQTDYVFVTV
jgi:hypothetical protein